MGARQAEHMRYPKIELHVHFEGTVERSTLLQIARRNDFALPARNADELAELYRFRDFAHFVTVWVLTTQALRRADDFRQIVVDYARQARPAERCTSRGSSRPPSRCGGEARGKMCSRATATAPRRHVSSTGSRCG